jgi:prepilin-type processing-associated H-X9-DG protein
MYSWVVPILPYLDSQELYNQWSMFATANGTGGTSHVTVSYLDGQTGPSSVQANLSAGQATNYKVSSTSIGVLRCPDDVTAAPNQGNLSYAVNGGFTLWHGPLIPYGWAGSAIDGQASPLLINWAGPSNTQPAVTWGLAQKLGVFFLESAFPEGIVQKIPWNLRSSLTSMQDGASSTIMLSENTLTGANTGNNYSALQETNWATPMSNFSMFIGSSNVCSTTIPVTPGSHLDCTNGGAGQAMLAPTGDIDGPTWAFANKVGTFSNIDYGQNLTLDGGYPFSNSAHPGGCNMVFCDGAVRFITNTIDGTVYSKLITPAGSRLPIYAKQQPVSQDAFAQ